MAFAQFDYFSESLRRTTTFSICIPNDTLPIFKEQYKEAYSRNMKTLYLLHGYSANRNAWLLGSRIEEFSLKYNIAVVFPNGDNSFYLDRPGAGNQYCSFIGEELVAYTREVFHLSDKQEDTYIGGLSMGGFGAIHVGLAFPETFSKIFALSSALIIHDIKNIEPGFQDNIADYDYYKETFSDLKHLDQSLNNPERQIEEIKLNGGKVPKLFMACGSEDFLIEQNRTFVEFLQKQEVPVDYFESSGVHDWDFWNTYLEPALKWLTEAGADVK